MVIALHKPYGVISQFTSDGSSNRTLAEFQLPKSVYPIGRLDADSEGLLVLSDEKPLVDRLLNPKQVHPRRYLVQVEHIPGSVALIQMTQGVEIKGGYYTQPCKVALLDPQPDIPSRVPPIRVRRTVSDCWIQIELTEGKNRQVRRMCAAIGHPVLRLIRKQIGGFDLGALPQGKWRKLKGPEKDLLLSSHGN